MNTLKRNHYLATILDFIFTDLSKYRSNLFCLPIFLYYQQQAGFPAWFPQFL